MTKEEAIVDIRDNIKPVVGGKSLDMAVKSLKQEPILDKIRVEIKALPRYSSNSNRYLAVYVDIYEVLKIIDKYRGESS